MNTNILDFGTIADGKTLVTTQIQAAIDKCAETGGGRVTVPQGVYLIGTLFLRSNVELYLEHSSVLLASTNMDDYNDLDAYEQNFSSTSEEWAGKHIIIAYECENVAITGSGTIDGNGDFFYEQPKHVSNLGWRCGFAKSKDKEKLRPGQAVCFIECKNVSVSDITLTNLTCWGIFLHGCEYASVRGLKVFNKDYFANTDGIDIDCCRYVTVSDCIIRTGDDAITLRGAESRLKNKLPCEYITVTNCVCDVMACAVRVGVGTGMIRHARLSNITVERAGVGIGVMTGYCGRGHVSIEDVHFSDISMNDTAHPFSITNGCEAHISNMSFKNMTMGGFARSVIENSGIGYIRDISFENVRIEYSENQKLTAEEISEKRGFEIFRAENIQNLSFKNVKAVGERKFLSCFKAISAENCTGELGGITVEYI